MKTNMKINPKIIRVNVENLLLDSKNPRLPENISVNDQTKIWKHMRKVYDLDELALSITNNGYFEAEPLVVIPKDTEFQPGDTTKYDEYSNNKDSQYIVVEGNRRLASIQGVRSDKLNYPLSDNLKKQFESLPVLFYPNRDDVLAFLGVHHLAGVRKWDVYERARYIAYLKEVKNYSMEDIQNTIGDRKNSARKVYICYRMIKQIEEYDESFGTKDPKNHFSLLLLATGQLPIREYIGFSSWDDLNHDTLQPIPRNKLDNLQFLFQCLFDSSNHKRLINESRDITNKLKAIFNNPESIRILEKEQKIELAYTMSGGALQGVMNMLNNAKSNLEFANGKLPGLQQMINEEEKNDLKTVVGSMYGIIEDLYKKYRD